MAHMYDLCFEQLYFLFFLHHLINDFVRGNWHAKEEKVETGIEFFHI
jgi:hypothetical protein